MPLAYSDLWTCYSIAARWTTRSSKYSWRPPGPGDTHGANDWRRLIRGVTASPRPTLTDGVDVRAVRGLTGLSQAKFAELLGIELATLRNWEQGRRDPTGPARALLRAIRMDPVGVIKALSS